MEVIINRSRAPLWKKNALSSREIRKLVIACFEKTKTFADSVFLNVNFTDAKTITLLNRQYRGIDKSTNVLSFANCDDKNVFYGRNHKTLFLGDLFFCFEKIQQEAEEYNKTFQDRLKHLFVHGALHLLGYDHIVENDRKVMEKIEEDILKDFEIFNIYSF